MTTAPVVIPPISVPVNITTTLQNIWNGEGMNIVWAALIAAWPPLATIFAVPVFGSALKSIASYFANNVIDGLIAQGVITIKIGIIQWLSASAQIKWAAELVILQQVRSAGGILTPEQEAAYDAALQQLGENHQGVVNA